MLHHLVAMHVSTEKERISRQETILFFRFEATKLIRENFMFFSLSVELTLHFDVILLLGESAVFKRTVLIKKKIPQFQFKLLLEHNEDFSLLVPTKCSLNSSWNGRSGNI